MHMQLLTLSDTSWSDYESGGHVKPECYLTGKSDNDRAAQYSELLQG